MSTACSGPTCLRVNELPHPVGRDDDEAVAVGLWRVALAGAAPRSNRLISGSGMTPKRLHSPSPMERDIAKPTRPSAHSRAGEAPLAPETTPPAPTMRSYSSGESGLQSTERSRARIAPSRT